MFQSAPVIADGRTQRIKEAVEQALMFQSAPVIADGRTPPHHWEPWRPHMRFNPRPSSLTGEPPKGLTVPDD